jgi:hypothetical protein
LAKLSILQQLIAQREDIDAAIRAIERVTGGAVESGVHRRAAKAWRMAKAARNGTAKAAEAEAPARRGPYKPRQAHKRQGLTAGREIEAMPVPPELAEAIGNLDFREAVALAVRSAGVAIPTPELVLLLQNAGVKFPEASKSVPAARYVGIIAGNLARQKRLKKTPNGWTKGTRV